MAKAMKQAPQARILFGAATALGPGKIDLLEAISETGSISAAAKRMGMSYRRAWNLVDVLNKSFRRPLVITASGGKGGGGAEVTETCREILVRYREIEQKALASVEREVAEFSAYLAGHTPRG